MDGNKTIGQMIGNVRSENNETQQQLADALGVKREMVTYWENGTREIKAGQLAEIAKRYHVSADYLLGISNYQTDNKVLTSVCKYTGLSPDAIDCILRIKGYSEADHANALDLLLSHPDADMLFRDINDAIALGKHIPESTPLLVSLQKDEQLSNILNKESLKTLQEKGYNVFTIGEQYIAMLYHISKRFDDMVMYHISKQFDSIVSKITKQNSQGNEG